VVGVFVVGELVAGPEPGDPQDASISAMTIPEIAVSAGDADRRIKPSLCRLRKDDGLIVHRRTLGIPWDGTNCVQIVAAPAALTASGGTGDSEAPLPRLRQRGFSWMTGLLAAVTA
jgi:hypothetical protein